MSDIDWTRVFLDAVGREADVAVPPVCDEVRRATASCPSWQEAVLETLPNLVELIQTQAAELRRMYRMNVDVAIVVDLPRWMESRLTEVDLELIKSGYVYVNWIDRRAG